MYKKLKKQSGFTLIELLVVVAIIGILSSVVLASLSDARAQARDTSRIADLKQIETALQLFFNDNGYFPCEVASRCSGQSVNANGRIGEGAGLDTLLEPYLGEVPHDPNGPGDSTYFYYYDGAHCNDSGKLNGASAVTISFNKAETKSNIRRDTTCGGEGNQHQADYTVIVGASDG